MTYAEVMGQSERQRVTQGDELLRAAAAQRLSEEPEVVVLRRSDEQVRREAEEIVALEEASR